MRTRFLPIRIRRRGATAVEMAIVAPLFFLLILAIVEFARMVMVQQALTNAAREGCRKATLTTTKSDSVVEARVRQHLQTSLANANDTGACRVTVTPSDFSTITEGTFITVHVEVNYSDVTWLPPKFLGNAVLHGKATVKRE